MENGSTPVHRTLLGFLAVVTGVLLLPFDFAVNVAFDAIRKGLNYQQADTYAIVVGYVLAYASLMLVCGRLGDIHGHKLIFMIGMVVSALAFAISSTAGEFSQLIAARILQGCGMALVYSSTFALLMGSIPGWTNRRVASLRETLVAAGAVAAPLIGGWLITVAGWEAVFWVRLPICLAGFLLAFFLPFRRAGGGKFDWWGAAFLLSTMLSLLLAAHYLVPITREMRVMLVLVGALSAIVFVIRESRCDDPIINLKVFKQPIFFVQQLASVAINGASFTVFLLLPFMVPKTPGWTFGDLGVVLALAGVGTLLGSIWFVWRPLQGRLATRALLLGLFVCSVGLALVGGAGMSNVGYLWSAVVLQGIGLGIFQGNYAASVASEIAQPGIASSLTIVTRTVGVVIGTFVFGLQEWFERSAELATAVTELAVELAFRQTFFAVSSFLFGVFVVLGLWWAGVRTERDQKHEPAR